VDALIILPLLSLAQWHAEALEYPRPTRFLDAGAGQIPKLFVLKKIYIL